jgi:O-succinylbenzoate synthase
MVCRSLGDAISQIFLFARDATVKYTQYDAQRKAEWLRTDYKRRQSFMNEPTQEFRKVVPYVARSNLQRCTVQPANRIR